MEKELCTYITSAWLSSLQKSLKTQNTPRSIDDSPPGIQCLAFIFSGRNKDDMVEHFTSSITVLTLMQN